MKRARAAEQALSPPEITVFTDATTSLANTITNQVNLTTSLSSLLDKVGILVKLGDEVAKVYPKLHHHYPCCTKIVTDPSLCEFCLASALSRVKSEAYLLVFELNR